MPFVWRGTPARSCCHPKDGARAGRILAAHIIPELPLTNEKDVESEDESEDDAEEAELFGEKAGAKRGWPKGLTGPSNKGAKGLKGLKLYNGDDDIYHHLDGQMQFD